jgi:hypothetical protein
LGIATFSVLLLADIIPNKKLLLMAAFTFADLMTILAGFGGIVFLINPVKTSQAKYWVGLNITLFFFATFMGVVLFLKL